MHRASVLGCASAVALLANSAPCLAESSSSLTLNLNSLSGDGSLNVSTSLLPGITLLPSVPSLPLNLPLNLPAGLTLNLDLPSGFALTSASCTGGDIVRVGTTNGFNLTANVPNVSCTFGTVNALLGSLETIVPLLVRQNDFLMSLDLGLDRQIDLLSDADSGGNDGWTKPSGLGGPAGFGLGGDPGSDGRMRLGGEGDGQPSSFSFATSLNQMRQANYAQPYGLGAGGPRPPPPSSSKFDVWAEGYLAHFEDDTGGFGADGHTGVLYVGADYLLTRQILIGALIQFDDTEEDLDTTWARRAKTTGWMAGPYATVRLPYNLYFQARAAWGQSDNEISSLPGTEDSFDADRWLVRGTLLGQWDSGPWRFQPRASVGYIAEDQEGYSNIYTPVPSQTVSLGQAKAGPQISYRERLSNGTVIEPSLLVEGIWNFHQDAGELSVDDFVTTQEVRARAEAGIMFYTRDGTSLGASVSYDGIGSSDYSAVGGRARVRVPLN